MLRTIDFQTGRCTITTYVTLHVKRTRRSCAARYTLNERVASLSAVNAFRLERLVKRRLALRQDPTRICLDLHAYIHACFAVHHVTFRVVTFSVWWRIWKISTKSEGSISSRVVEILVSTMIKFMTYRVRRVKYERFSVAPIKVATRNPMSGQ